jgi:hypothetical protein
LGYIESNYDYNQISWPEDFSDKFMEKANTLGLFDWSYGLSRNIKAIIDMQD